ncbi:MAG: TrkH family potassium uptake protein [Bacteroidales bacterium]|nr:TrkH family potassium uptake protein [Bacteroidales bacterium]
MKRRTATINFPLVARIIGWLLMIEAVFLAVPLVTSLCYAEKVWKGFAIATGAAAACGALMTFCIHPRSRDMGKREGFLLTALVWVVFSVFGMIPFMMCNEPLNFSEAYFEAMSGFTTTGASVIPSVTGLSHALLLWRGEMNWIGGMGIILFTLAVLPMLNHSGGMQMFNAEVTGITHDKLRPRVSQTAKGLWMVYILLTVVLLLLLWAGPMDFFESVCHALSTISTGGFSTRDGSVGEWHSVYVDVVITVFMFLGGVNFTLLYRAFHGDTQSILRNDVFKTFLRIIAIYYVLVVAGILIQGRYTGICSVTVEPLFEIISAMTSTGYNVTDYELWGAFTLSLIFFMMFFGACAGSTSGGAKIDRLLYLVKNLHNEIYRCVHPNSILAVRVNGQVMSQEVVSKVIAFLCLYVLTIAVGGVVLTALGIPLVDAFFSAFSCISNVGFGAGLTGYGSSYDTIPDLGKWVLSLIMLIGRLEVFTVMILFSPGFWRK